MALRAWAMLHLMGCRRSLDFFPSAILEKPVCPCSARNPVTSAADGTHEKQENCVAALIFRGLDDMLSSPCVAPRVAELEKEMVHGRYRGPPIPRPHLAARHATHRQFTTHPCRHTGARAVLLEQVRKAGPPPRRTHPRIAHGGVVLRGGVGR